MLRSRRTALITVIAVASALLLTGCDQSAPQIFTKQQAADSEATMIAAMNDVMRTTGGPGQWVHGYDGTKPIGPSGVSFRDDEDVECMHRDYTGSVKKVVGESARITVTSKTVDVDPKLHGIEKALAGHTLTELRWNDVGKGYRSVTFSGDKTDPSVTLTWFNGNGQHDVTLQADALCRAWARAQR